MSERADAVKAFFADLSAVEEAQPTLFGGGAIGIFPAQNKFGVLPENHCDLDLDVLAADVAGAGWGGTVMRLLTALADRHGLDVYVKANANDEEESPDAIPQGDLETFYAGLGFVDVGSWDARDMVRRASPPSSESVDLLERAMTSVPLWRQGPSAAP
jgi:hypothetical protein